MVGRAAGPSCIRCHIVRWKHASQPLTRAAQISLHLEATTIVIMEWGVDNSTSWCVYLGWWALSIAVTPELPVHCDPPSEDRGQGSEPIRFVLLHVPSYLDILLKVIGCSRISRHAIHGSLPRLLPDAVPSINHNLTTRQITARLAHHPDRRAPKFLRLRDPGHRNMLDPFLLELLHL